MNYPLLFIWAKLALFSIAIVLLAIWMITGRKSDKLKVTGAIFALAGFSIVLLTSLGVIGRL